MKLVELIMESISYDSMTRIIVKDIMKHFKSSTVKSGEISMFQSTYHPENFAGREMYLNISARLEYVDEEGMRVTPDTGVDTDDEIPSIDIGIQIQTDLLPQFWDEIYFLLVDVVRHEIEHVTQSGEYRKSGKPDWTEEEELHRQLISMGLLDQHMYLLIPREIDANLQGLRMKAKKLRTSIGTQIRDYFDILGLNQQQREEVLKIWRERAKEIGINQTF